MHLGSTGYVICIAVFYAISITPSLLINKKKHTWNMFSLPCSALFPSLLCYLETNFFKAFTPDFVIYLDTSQPHQMLHTESIKTHSYTHYPTTATSSSSQGISWEFCHTFLSAHFIVGVIQSSSWPNKTKKPQAHSLTCCWTQT